MTSHKYSTLEWPLDYHTPYMENELWDVTISVTVAAKQHARFAPHHQYGGIPNIEDTIHGKWITSLVCNDLSLLLLWSLDMPSLRRANNGGGTLFCCYDDVLQDSFGTNCKFLKLKYSHWSIPDNGSCSLNDSGEGGNGLLSNIKTHPAIRNTGV